MRRLTGLAAASLTLLLFLSACSSDGGDTPDPSASGASEPAATELPKSESATVTDAGMPTASGAFGEKPEITFPDSDAPTALQVQVLSQGDGAAIESGQSLKANYLGQVWGGDVFDNSYDRGMPAVFQIGTGAVINGWDKALVGQKLGSRVMISIPPGDGYGSTGSSDGSITGTDTIVFVVDLIATYELDAAGQADATPVEGLDAATLPTVTGALGAAATITVQDGLAAPTADKITVIATGTGEPIAVGGAVVQMAGTLWDNSQSMSTWTSTGATIMAVQAAGATTPSPFDGLVGVPIGSRVIVEVAATDSAAGQAYVVDVIGQA